MSHGEGRAPDRCWDDMRLSVLDLVPVRSDQTTGDALAATRRLAQVADELGFERYWLAEHHNMPAVAATNPPVLIAMVAAATSRIRVGSGGVMLPNHAPLVVAEQFALLEAAHPGPDRPRHRARARHRPGHLVGAAARRRRRLRRGGHPVPDVRRQRDLDDEPGRGGPPGQRPDARAERDPARGRPAAGVAARLLGLLGAAGGRARAALRLRPPLLRARAPPRRSTLYRSTFQPSEQLVRAAHLPDRQRGRRATPRRRPRGWCCPTCTRWSRCAPASRCRPSCCSRRRSPSRSPPSTRRWPTRCSPAGSSAPPTRPPSRSTTSPRRTTWTR